MIRFKKHPWRAVEDVPGNRSTVDPRRIAAARKAIVAQREREGLFAQDGDVDDAAIARLIRFNDAAEAHLRDERRRRAADWWRARAALRALPSGTRRELLHRWNTAKTPAAPGYLLSQIWSTSDPAACAIVAAGWEMNMAYMHPMMTPELHALEQQRRADEARTLVSSRGRAS